MASSSHEAHSCRESRQQQATRSNCVLVCRKWSELVLGISLACRRSEVCPQPSPPSFPPPPSPPARKHGGGVSVPEAGTFGVG